ncbi:MAG: TraX family protein, partial [Clostridia bacterium]|nr:TraX family protein [Clostridia bacterium]
MHNTIEKNGLSKSALQTIAIIAMVIDHLAQFTTNIYLYYIMKLIGRITIVIMCYFVAEGYYKTSNIGRYLLRLGIFAVISQIPYYLMIRHGNFPNGILPLGYSILMNRNVIFTLFVGLALLAIIKSDYTIALKIISAAAALWLVRCSDWGY